MARLCAPIDLPKFLGFTFKSFLDVLIRLGYHTIPNLKVDGSPLQSLRGEIILNFFRAKNDDLVSENGQNSPNNEWGLRMKEVPRDASE